MTAFIVPYGGLRLDRVAKAMLQTERQGAVEAILDANPGLSAVASNGFVPADTVIRYPTGWQPASTQRLVLAWE